jgi:two-component system, chemotaxis family, CheB/CheR fusion protein
MKAHPKAKLSRPSKSQPRKTPARPSSGNDFPVVAIGASAGGLEAVSHLLSALPPATGMAFVLIQHIPPDHTSSLVPLLARVTRMKVSEAADGVIVQPNHVYVVPPGQDLFYARPVLRVKPRDIALRHYLPIDAFMESLAKWKRERAIGIVLSGTGTDGTRGLQKIHAEGGITFAQTKESARFDGMPNSAITSGSTDFVLPPRQIAAKLARLANDIVLPESHKKLRDSAFYIDALKRILEILRSSTGSDFSLYRSSTILRRIRRRMAFQKTKQLGEYAAFLGTHPDEVKALRQDMLIHVTSFFRDASAFELLKKKVFARLLRERLPEDPIRVWVPGCATGEEVYSLAICLLEARKAKSENVSFQMFGTDISEESLAKARKGIYAAAELQHVSPKRLRQFFTHEGGIYKVKKEIRERCLFAKQDILQDTPFSRLDLISCRNLLIYLTPAAQSRIIPLFHYALRPGGYLLLGKAESITGHSAIFATVNRVHRLYTKKAVPSRINLFREGSAVLDSTEPIATRLSTIRANSPAAPRPEAILLARHGPPAILVNSNLEILRFSGQLSPYLDPATGEASLNLLKLARPDLVWEIRSTIQKSQKSGRPFRVAGILLDHLPESQSLTLEVIPVPGTITTEKSFWVVFESVSPAVSATSTEASGRVLPRSRDSAASRHRARRELHRAARLERELAQTKAGLRETIQEQEAANEELQSANEEVLSRNEELQSINEEFETAKEELQSSNEELTTLNEELDHRHSEMVLLNTDLNNLFASLDIPIVILGRDHRIRRFSPAAESLFNLMPSDVGRPIGDLHFGAMYAGLRAEINSVIETGKTCEREMAGPNGRWLSLRIHPYRGAGKEILGAMLVLVDIHALRHAGELVEEQRQYSEAIIAALRESLLVLDSDLRIVTANKSFQDAFNLAGSQIVGKSIFEIGAGQWDFPHLRKLLQSVLTHDSNFVDLEVDHVFPVIGRRTLLLNARSFLRQSDDSPLILLAIQDETLHRHAQHMSAQLLRIQDEERRRFARELHDSTSQSLAALTMNMKRLTDAAPASDGDLRALLAESQQLAQSSIKEIRTVSYMLHPPLLDEAGLASAIRTYSTGFSKRSGIQIDLRIPEQVPRLPKDMELALFRICQECLNNIHHHSGSDSARIKLAVTSQKVVLTVSDKGKGLGADLINQNGDAIGGVGVGIPSMQERARQLGGALEINSTPAGATIRAILPLPHR